MQVVLQVARGGSVTVPDCINNRSRISTGLSVVKAREDLLNATDRQTGNCCHGDGGKL